MGQPVTTNLHKIVFGTTNLPHMVNGRTITSEEICMKVPMMTKTTTLLPGDIINTSSNHIVQILRVGANPLALNSRQSSEECDQIRQQDFDFDFANSIKSQFYSGVQIQSAKNSKSNNLRQLVIVAKQVCKDLLHADSAEPKVFKWGTSYAYDQTPGYLSILRHNSEKAGCTFTPLKLVGEECIESYLN